MRILIFLLATLFITGCATPEQRAAQISAEVDDMVKRYQQLGIALNEVNRSMGLLDVVPEIFVEAVVMRPIAVLEFSIVVVTCATAADAVADRVLAIDACSATSRKWPWPSL